MNSKLNPSIGMLLGSGASNHADLPTSGQIIEKTGFKTNPAYNIILEKCDSEDIEEVLQKIEDCFQWTESGKGLLEDWMFKTFSFQKTSNVSPNPHTRYTIKSLNQHCTSMLNHIVKILPDLFKINNEQKKQITELYEPFFNQISSINPTIDIFTTNYDSVIEEFVYQQPTGYHYSDGFPSEKTSEFSLEKLTQSISNGNNTVLNVYRLHGGLDWYKGNNINGDCIYKNFDLDDRPIEQKVVIPPILGKNVKDHPLLKPIYDVFAQKFLEYDLCIVIGFSFRDKDIAEIISNRIKENKKTLLIGPHVFSDISKHLSLTLQTWNVKNSMNDVDVTFLLLTKI